MTDIKSTLIHAATEYDRKQSAKRGYNRYALAQYFMAIDEAAEVVARGNTWNDAINWTFSDRLRDALLKAIPANATLT